MKLKNLLPSILALAVFLSIPACKKENTTTDSPVTVQPAATTTADVPLTTAQSDFLAAVADTFISLRDMILPNGQSVDTFLQINDPAFLISYPSGRISRPNSVANQSQASQKNLFLARMLAMGNYLTYDPNHIHPAEGANGPAQTKLAYSWGSKDWYIRQFPPVDCGCMDKKIYGLDCTGMIWEMTKLANNITVEPKSNFTVSAISDKNKWTAAFGASSDYKDLVMENMGQLTEDEMQTGDIILWGRHVGVYLNGHFFQSNGDPNAPECIHNLDSDKGPRTLSLAEILSWHGLGAYKVFRIANPSHIGFWGGAVPYSNNDYTAHWGALDPKGHLTSALSNFSNNQTVITFDAFDTSGSFNYLPVSVVFPGNTTGQFNFDANCSVSAANYLVPNFYSFNNHTSAGGGGYLSGTVTVTEYGTVGGMVRGRFSGGCSWLIVQGSSSTQTTGSLFGEFSALRQQ